MTARLRAVSFSTIDDAPDARRVGVVTADGTGIVELRERMGGVEVGERMGGVELRERMGEVGSLDQIIEAGALAELEPFVDEPADHALEAVVLHRPLAWPRKIFCIGVNYGGRAAEYADTSDAAYPSVFVRFPDSFTGHDHPLIRPPESAQLDYEGEIVVVIGKAGRRIPVDRSRDHIAGLTLGNEGTIRDWVRHAKFNVTQGKNWESTGAIGPWIVPIDEFGDLEQLHLTTRVNGELRQDDTPATMKYPIDYQVHYLSTFTTLRPGDLIFTGTPTGAGARFDPPVWLEPGDVVEVEVPEIGILRNPIADEFAHDEPGARFRPPEPR